jgi:hypothetical protein
MPIPIAVVPVAPFRNAAEIVAIAHSELAHVLEVADAVVVAPAELLVAGEAPLDIADLMPIAAMPTILYASVLYASEIAIAARLLLYALLGLALVTVGLEVGEAVIAAAAPIDALGLTIGAATLHALRLALTTAAATLHALGLTVTAAATTFGALCLLAATAAMAFGLLAASTATALALGLAPMAAALSTALVGLR